MTGTSLPDLVTSIPGPASRAAVDVLARHECPAVTARRARRASEMGREHDDPVVWSEALGANVRDVDGNVFVDLTGGFGVALVGHRHPAVVGAATAQAARLPHASGDAWPDETRIALLARLAALAPGDLSVAILGLSGSDSVDAAVKTAVLATGRSGVLVFGGAYHGLALGVVALQDVARAFVDPFRPIVHPEVRRLPYGADPSTVRDALSDGTVGLVLVEPILGRGGTVVPPERWIADVATEARRAHALFALDEVLTGIGRTGVVFRGPAEGVVPDLLCLGKALGGGFPISACLGTPEVMDAWGPSAGAAIHTQTFLGHPIGCAAALAVLDLVDDGLPAEVARRGDALATSLSARGWTVRGAGLLHAVEVGDGLTVSRKLTERGFLVLPAGPTSIQLTPPVTLADPQIEALLDALDAVRA
jgi:4-aminobutyrate aminotransferase-like enzyme